MRSFFTSLPFVILSAVSMSVFSFDLYIPCLPSIALWFDTTQEYAKLTISAGIVGSSLFTLILGPLSDAVGRRLILVYSQLLFCIASFIAAFSPSIEFLMVIRFIQGVGSSAAIVLSLAIIADSFPRKRAAAYFAYVSTTITVTLVVAPMLGGWISSYLSWHYCFTLLGVLAAFSFVHLYFFLPETLKEHKPFSAKGALQSYHALLKSPTFILMSFAPSLMIGGFIAFISSLSFHFITGLGMTSFKFSLYQAGMMFFNALSSFLSGKIILHWGPKKTAYSGMIVFVSGGILLYLVTLIEQNDPLMLSSTFALYGAGLGLVFAAVTSENMALSPAPPGTTSAAIAFIRGCLISTIISIESLIRDESILSLSRFIFILVFVVMGLFLCFRHKLTPHAPQEAIHS